MRAILHRFELRGKPAVIARENDFKGKEVDKVYYSRLIGGKREALVGETIGLDLTKFGSKEQNKWVPKNST